MFELFHKIDEEFGGSTSWNTQPNCRAIFTIATALLSPFFLNLVLGCSSTWRCAQEHFSPHLHSFGLVEQAFWRMPFFTEWVIASSSKVILARPSKRSTAGTFSSGTWGSRWFSLILLHERSRRRIRLCRFSTLLHIVPETDIVSFRTLPVSFPLPTISKNSLFTLFCPLILDRGVPFMISVSGLKILHLQILLGTSF